MSSSSSMPPNPSEQLGARLLEPEEAVEVLLGLAQAPEVDGLPHVPGVRCQAADEPVGQVFYIFYPSILGFHLSPARSK